MSCPLCTAVQLLKEFVESLERGVPETEKLKDFVRLVEVETIQGKTIVAVTKDFKNIGRECTRHTTWEAFADDIAYLNQPEVLQLIFAGAHGQPH